MLFEGEAREAGGLVQRLVHEAESGEIEEHAFLMLIVHIATAGHAATAFALGNGLLTLALHGAAWEELRREPDLVPEAVEEVLRYDSPTHITTRFAVQDVQLRGRRIRPGQAVHLVVGAANRDPAQFPDPDVFDIHRGARQLAFGLGIHFCLGAPLGTLELEMALRELLARYARLELVADGYEPGGTLLLRGPRRLVMRCEV